MVRSSACAERARHQPHHGALVEDRMAVGPGGQRVGRVRAA